MGDIDHAAILRQHADTRRRGHSVNPDVIRAAAEEIERLRRRLLAEENAYDIERRQNEHLQTDRNNLALEVERLRAELVSITNKLTAERDEARRMVCEKEETLGCDERGVPRNGSARDHAKQRGWDCFKEDTDV